MRNIIPLLFIALFLSCSPKYQLDFSRPVKPIELPADEAAHYSCQMEWWYYTGHLFADDGNEYGFEVTFFKRMMNEDHAPGCLSFIPLYWFQDVGMVGHFAISDLKKNEFVSKDLPNVFRSWRADPDILHVGINGWLARSVDGAHIVKADMHGYQIDVKLKPLKPPALNGPDGIVGKGGDNANYYYSYTSLAAEGFLTVDGKKKLVRGKAWMDHEFGTMRLVKTQKGWDWFSIQLDNNTELMIYLLRDKNDIVTESGGTFVSENGGTRWLKLTDFELKSTKTWLSSKTGTIYPSEWEITVKPLNMKLHVVPLMDAQELDIYPVTYWEGAVSIDGSYAGKAVKGRGYIELVGYSKESSFKDVKL